MTMDKHLSQARIAEVGGTEARTPGPRLWEALPAADDGAIVIVYTLHGTHRATTYDPSTAKLIVDAGNTLSATGRMPSQLAQQCADLIAALSLMVAVYAKNCVAEGEPSTVLDAARAALAKVPHP